MQSYIRGQRCRDYARLRRRRWLVLATLKGMYVYTLFAQILRKNCGYIELRRGTKLEKLRLSSEKEVASSSCT